MLSTMDPGKNVHDKIESRAATAKGALLSCLLFFPLALSILSFLPSFHLHPLHPYSQVCHTCLPEFNFPNTHLTLSSIQSSVVGIKIIPCWSGLGFVFAHPFCPPTPHPPPTFGDTAVAQQQLLPCDSHDQIKSVWCKSCVTHSAGHINPKSHAMNSWRGHFATTTSQ